MAERLPKPTTAHPRTLGSPQYPNLVFVSHDASTSPGEHNTNISHGRRLQIDKRHRDKKLLAQQGATYARSLVGWKPPAVTAENASSSWRQAPGEVNERDEEEIERQKTVSP